LSLRMRMIRIRDLCDGWVYSSVNVAISPAASRGSLESKSRPEGPGRDLAPVLN
jgi:hypothetical protein